jgi:hypothetical protein
MAGVLESLCVRLENQENIAVRSIYCDRRVCKALFDRITGLTEIL